jgi:hypothetical protein
MPRQPLLPTYKFASYGIDPWDLDKIPKIAELTGRCIMCWSHAQFQMGLFLSAMMGSNSEASVAIFLALQNAKSRRDVLVAAANARLDGDGKELFNALMIIYQSLDAQRNDLAHGLFSHSEDIKDGALWVSSQDEAQHTINILLNFKKPIEWDFPIAKEHTFFYKVKDLETLHKQMFEFWQAVFAFTVYVR